ncbi:MAG TPA: YciI family protein [Kribbellaceae bacterium]|jgi:hypothetical protein
MRYMLMLCGDETAGAKAELMTGCAEWTAEMAARGVLLGAEGLHPPRSATAIRVRDGEVLRTDGPFAESKEQIGGYVLIRCRSADEALEVAASHPWAAEGTIEVRQLLDVAPS